MARQAKLERESAVETAAETAIEAGERAGRQARNAATDAGEQARRVTERLSAVMQCGPIFAGAAQSVSQDWLSYAQGALRRNVQGMTSLTRCRTIRDLVDAQNERFAQEMDEFVQISRRASERMLGAARDAASRIDEGAGGA